MCGMLNLAAVHGWLVCLVCETCGGKKPYRGTKSLQSAVNLEEIAPRPPAPPARRRAVNALLTWGGLLEGIWDREKLSTK